MSAGLDAALPVDTSVHAELRYLAPQFRAAVEAAVSDCAAAGCPVLVYETYRTDALQRVYYARGRTVTPPAEPVTNARTTATSWHGYGLAVDVIHPQLRWSAPAAWWAQVAAIFERHGCAWGGRWTSPDRPHFQWGKCRTSPSWRARYLRWQGGLPAVWTAVGAA